jgi:hypothetical protein
MKWLVGMVLSVAASGAQAALYTVVCEGLGGEATYGEQFSAQGAAVGRAAKSLGAADTLSVLNSKECTRDAFSTSLQKLGRSLKADDRLALYLIGHGSFDSEDFRFNIAGPDFTGRELVGWLNALPAKDQLVVATGSSSGALQELLKSPTRVVITATRGGAERNAPRFGADFAAALTDAAADTDKNGSLSAKEAFEFAEKRIKGFYEREVRVASEHAVISGERAPRFVVARLTGGGATGASAATVGASAAGSGDTVGVVDSPERQKITDAIDALRLRKSDLNEEKYNEQLEALLLQLATLDAAGSKGPQ